MSKGMRFFVTDRVIDRKLLKFDHQSAKMMFEAPDFNVHNLEELVRRMAPKLKGEAAYTEHVFDNEDTIFSDAVWEFSDSALLPLASMSVAKARRIGKAWHDSNLREHLGLHKKGAFVQTVQQKRSREDDNRMTRLVKSLEFVLHENPKNIQDEMPKWYARNKSALSGRRDISKFKWEKTEVDDFLPSVGSFSRKVLNTLKKSAPSLVRYIQKKDREYQKEDTALLRCAPRCEYLHLMVKPPRCYEALFTGLRRLALTALKDKQALFLYTSVSA